MFSQNKKSSDEGVSPVIGVILMVAITVILAAVIGTFVLDLGGNVQQNAQASVTFDQSPATQIDTTDDGSNNPDTATYEVTAQVVSLQGADSVELSATDGDNTQIENEGGNADPTTASDSVDNGGSDLEAYGPNIGTTSLSSVGTSSSITQLTAADSITATGVLEGERTVLQTYEVSA